MVRRDHVHIGAFIHSKDLDDVLMVGRQLETDKNFEVEALHRKSDAIIETTRPRDMDLSHLELPMFVL